MRKRIFIILLFLLVANLLFSNSIGNCKFIGPNGNYYFLSQNILQIEKIIGEPDEIYYYEFPDRSRDELDIIKWEYDWGITFNFFKGNNKVIRIDCLTPILTTSIGEISTEVSSIKDVYANFDAHVLTSDFEDNKSLVINGLSEDDIMGPEYLLKFQYTSTYSHTTITKISMYYPLP